MKIVSGFKNVECSKCKKNHTINISDVDFNEGQSDERQMGLENFYYGVWEDKCSCGNSMEAEIEIYEYPVGCLELAQIINCKGINKTSEEISKLEIDWEIN